MRSTSSTHRRLRSRPVRHRPIDAIAALVDESAVDEGGHLLFHAVEEPDGEVALCLQPLSVEVHPFTALAGFTAPPEWSLVGLRVRGKAHRLERDRPAEPSVTTFVVDRSGADSSLLRTSEGPRRIPGPAVGTLPDLCRRVLGVPTAPAPPGTGLLWSVAWLDRILEAWGDPARRPEVERSWAELAALHPAVSAAPEAGPLEPDRLVALAREHARSWPWQRLREEPAALRLPDGDLSAEVTAWMDDGFYARWALGSFPAPATLARDVCALLDEELGWSLVAALQGLLD